MCTLNAVRLSCYSPESSDVDRIRCGARLSSVQRCRPPNIVLLSCTQAIPVSQRTLRDGSVRFEQVIWVPNENVRRAAVMSDAGHGRLVAQQPASCACCAA